ncbi:MAG: PQQ-binding-like beta-propeller repeat protein [Kofleriaceae bacterium]
MKAIAVKCPHCGARLQIAEARDTLTCEYCGTTSRIQRRTRMLERVMPPPPMVQGRPPMPIAVQRRSGAMMIVALVIPVVFIGVIIGGVMLATRGIASHVAAVREEAAQPTWQGTEGVIIRDINGDGVPDYLGRTRRLGGVDEIRVVALDGKSGTALWESDRLGNYSETFQGHLALAGDLILFTSTRAEIRAFAVKDGKQRWTTKLPERVARYCEGGDPQTIPLIGSDDVTRLVNRATGAVSNAPPVVEEPVKQIDKKKPKRVRVVKPTCPALPTDRQASSDRPDYELGRKHGISADRLAVGPGGRVLGGTRDKGTRVAMLVMLGDGDAAKWRVEVPKDPLAAAERAPEHVVVGDTEVCATYHGDSGGSAPRLACFALADGKRLWDSALGKSPLSALAIAGKTVVISQWGSLEAHDTATGTVRWRYGR